MSYKTVLLHLNSEQNCESVIKAGISIAERHGAHLIGLYVIPPVVVYMGVSVPAVVNSFHDDYYTNLSKSIKDKFMQYIEGRPFTSEWRIAQSADTSVTNTVSLMTHTADLLVMGNDTSDANRSVARSQLEAIITSTCRPTLIVPVDGLTAEFGQSVLIAWDGTDEATRAVFDSLPLLKLTENVVVHRINPTGLEKHHTLGTSTELVSTLSRHGINVELSFSEEPRQDIASELFRMATEKGADTVVMGAFGHSKVHGMLLGSVSGSVLQTMKIPVLMSH